MSLCVYRASGGDSWGEEDDCECGDAGLQRSELSAFTREGSPRLTTSALHDVSIVQSPALDPGTSSASTFPPVAYPRCWAGSRQFRRDVPWRSARRNSLRMSARMSTAASKDRKSAAVAQQYFVIGCNRAVTVAVDEKNKIASERLTQ